MKAARGEKVDAQLSAFAKSFHPFTNFILPDYESVYARSIIPG